VVAGLYGVLSPQSEELDELEELAGLLSLLLAAVLLSLLDGLESLLPPSPLLALALSDFVSWPAPFGPRFLEP
jgi:hypothetical protein